MTTRRPHAPTSRAPLHAVARPAAHGAGSADRVEQGQAHGIAVGARTLSVRVLIILAVLIVAVVMVIPSFRSYMNAQRGLAEANAQLADVQAENQQLSDALKLWNDDEFVRAQARERLGYVMPGQTLYVVFDGQDMTAAQRQEQAVRQAQAQRRAVTPWFMTLKDSLELAGRAGVKDTEEENLNAVPLLNETPGAEGTGSSKATPSQVSPSSTPPATTIERTPQGRSSAKSH
ncbi:MAG: septum formation initiator family protein [Actinomycetaceae bacterium]|nr:septum formation initiator family protein [Actinomycetaceae bacterium]MDY6083553.1 septum formation initiator family protein [Actinomycetaceae bacterium]